MIRRDSLWRRVATIGLPALGTVLIEPIYTTTDTAIMGHVGADAIGALALATGVLAIVIVPFTSFGFAITSRAARMSGAGDTVGIPQYGVASVLGFLIMGIVVASLIAVTASPLTTALASKTGVGRLSAQYLQISSIGIPFLFVFEAGGSFLTGLGRTPTALAISLVAALTNVGTEVYFVFGRHLGVAGSATGTVIAQVVGALATLLVLRLPMASPVAAFRLLRAALVGFLPAAKSLVIRTFTLVGAISGSVFLASRQGVDTLAEFQIGQQVWFLFGLSLDAIAVPAQVMVGEWVGADEVARIREWGRRFLLLGLACSVLLALLIVLFRSALVDIFTNSSLLRVDSRTSVVFAALVMPMTAISFVVDGLAGGLERFDLLRNAMLVSFAFFVGTSVLVLVLGTRVGVAGVWISFGGWLVVRSAASIYYWRRALDEAEGGGHDRM